MRSIVARHPMVTFFVLAYGLSWFGWPLAIAFGWPLPFFAGGPLVAALIVVGATSGRAGLRAWASRIIRCRVGWRWYAAALGLPLTVLLVTVALNVALGASAPSLAQLGSLSGLALIFGARIVDPNDGPLGEEPGWRGFALPGLQAGHSPLIATVVLGLLVAGWHLPLAFVGGMHPLDFLGPVAFAFVSTWLFNHTGGSAFMTLVMHAAEGTIHPGMLWSLQSGAAQAQALYPLVWCAIALGVVLFDWGSWRSIRPSAPVRVRFDALSDVPAVSPTH